VKLVSLQTRNLPLYVYKSLPKRDDFFTAVNISRMYADDRLFLVLKLCALERDSEVVKRIMTAEVLYTIAIGSMLLLVVIWIILNRGLG